MIGSLTQLQELDLLAGFAVACSRRKELRATCVARCILLSAPACAQHSQQGIPLKKPAVGSSPFSRPRCKVEQRCIFFRQGEWVQLCFVRLQGRTTAEHARAARAVHSVELGDRSAAAPQASGNADMQRSPMSRTPAGSKPAAGPSKGVLLHRAAERWAASNADVPEPVFPAHGGAAQAS